MNVRTIRLSIRSSSLLPNLTFARQVNIATAQNTLQALLLLWQISGSGNRLRRD